MGDYRQKERRDDEEGEAGRRVEGDAFNFGEISLF